MKDEYIFIDFETFYDTKNKYDLKHISIVEYVRSPLFKVFGAAIAKGYQSSVWLNDEQLRAYFARQDWSKTVVVAHNAKFDGFILTEHYGIRPKRWMDAKSLSKAVLGKKIKNHSLKTLAEYFKLEEKGQLKTDGLVTLTPRQEQELALYCRHDTELCREIYVHLKDGFPEGQRKALDWTIRAFVEPQFVLNTALLEKEHKREAAMRAGIFEQLGIDKETFSSNPKFRKLLESKGYKVPEKPSPSVEGKMIPALSVGDTAFLEMLNSADPLLKQLCEARVIAKSTLLETRSAKLLEISRTGLWPFDVEFSGAQQTHRYSGGSGAGGNPQNFTKCQDDKEHKKGHECDGFLRAAVEAPQGKKLVVGDFAAIEMRLVAFTSGDPGLIEGIEKGLDLYCDFASAFYGRVITKADVQERKFGKTAILGLGYGMGWEKFQKTVEIQTGMKITEEEARRAVRLYRAKYQEVKRTWNFLEQMIPVLVAGPTDDSKHYINLHGLALEYGKQWVKLPSGLTLKFPNLRKEGREWLYDVWRGKKEIQQAKLYGGKFLENICQAIAGELCKESIERVGAENVAGQMHDEILMVVPEEEAELAANGLEIAMTTKPTWFPHLILGAEVGIGKNWLGAKGG